MQMKRYEVGVDTVLVIATAVLIVVGCFFVGLIKDVQDLQTRIQMIEEAK